MLTYLPLYSAKLVITVVLLRTISVMLLHVCNNNLSSKLPGNESNTGIFMHTLTYVCRVTKDRVLTHADVMNVTLKLTNRLTSFAKRLEATNRDCEQSNSHMHCGTGDTIMLFAITTTCLMSSAITTTCLMSSVYTIVCFGVLWLQVVFLRACECC